MQKIKCNPERKTRQVLHIYTELPQIFRIYTV